MSLSLAKGYNQCSTDKEADNWYVELTDKKEETLDHEYHSCHCLSLECQAVPSLMKVTKAEI